MRYIVALLVLTSAASAQTAAEISEAMLACEAQKSRPYEVRPESNYRTGYEDCDKVAAACAKMKPNCVLQAQQDKGAEQKKKIDDLIKRLK